ncbi:hypothetical protein GCM10025331_81830 [Actinoplanes utahensis]|uniref:Peptidase M23B n=1 Tax=Actinoplanes utahensis TaxID=1869 RepID=A0A0A6ULB9_ACTUT|nr:hypothetical protein MB27_20645 [Actinoplanes utahensis]GIF32251.1 hypothetical protein Aut01nite_52370 [Actinoplanes utahensis]
MAALAVAAAVVVAPAQVATAAPAAFAEQARAAGLDQREARQLQSQVDQVLAEMKVGGRQISANEVLSNDGLVKVVVPVPGEERARALSGSAGRAVCTYEYLCLFDGPNYTGLMRELYACSMVNLGNYGQHDRLESYYNNQTIGTVANFYNWTGSWGRPKFGSTAPHSDPNLWRWGWQNMIDGVDPC